MQGCRIPQFILETTNQKSEVLKASQQNDCGEGEATLGTGPKASCTGCKHSLTDVCSLPWRSGNEHSV